MWGAFFEEWCGSKAGSGARRRAERGADAERRGMRSSIVAIQVHL